MKISKKILKVLLWIVIVLVSLLVLGAVSFIIARAVGKGNLYQGRETVPVISELALEEAVDGYEWKEGDIRYQGDIYRYNEDILTFLILGIDEEGKVAKKGSVKNYTKGGQSDAIFLAVLNPHTKELSLVAVNRDTMTDIAVYDKNNQFVMNMKKQITLQHAYGDGRELSCERTVKVVSNLFYQIPIHGYCAINMGVIPVMNDGVGGVEVTLLENISVGSSKIKNSQGKTVTLKGKDAFWYVKYRDTGVFNSASQRIERQKQWLNAYLNKVKAETKKDITFPIKVYSDVSPYMVTDITTSEISYLAPEVLDYSFDFNHIYSLQGESVMGEEFEEFYPEEEALRELVIRLFYEKIES